MIFFNFTFACFCLYTIAFFVTVNYPTKNYQEQINQWNVIGCIIFMSTFHLFTIAFFTIGDYMMGISTRKYEEIKRGSMEPSSLSSSSDDSSDEDDDDDDSEDNSDDDDDDDSDDDNDNTSDDSDESSEKKNNSKIVIKTNEDFEKQFVEKEAE